MPDYWLDSDALIQSKNEPYGFDIAPRFWEFLERKIADGTIASCQQVYDELQDGKDELSAWARRQKACFMAADQGVQAVFGHVSVYVKNHYDEMHAREFLRGADGWLIAHARVHGGETITREVPAPDSKRPKIPDVARQFGVQTLRMHELLRKLKARIA